MYTPPPAPLAAVAEPLELLAPGVKKGRGRSHQFAGLLRLHDAAPTWRRRWAWVGPVAAHLCGVNNLLHRREARESSRLLDPIFAPSRRIVLVATNKMPRWTTVQGADDAGRHLVAVAWKLLRADDLEQDWPYYAYKLAKSLRKAAVSAENLQDGLALADALIRDTVFDRSALRAYLERAKLASGHLLLGLDATLADLDALPADLPIIAPAAIVQLPARPRRMPLPAPPRMLDTDPLHWL